jgi:hypothetical protein
LYLHFEQTEKEQAQEQEQSQEQEQAQEQVQDDQTKEEYRDPPEGNRLNTLDSWWPPPPQFETLAEDPFPLQDLGPCHRMFELNDTLPIDY